VLLLLLVVVVVVVGAAKAIWAVMASTLKASVNSLERCIVNEKKI
jgi:hypothetical protein